MASKFDSSLELSPFDQAILRIVWINEKGHIGNTWHHVFFFYQKGHGIFPIGSYFKTVLQWWQSWISNGHKTNILLMVNSRKFPAKFAFKWFSDIREVEFEIFFPKSPILKLCSPQNYVLWWLPSWITNRWKIY
jgi:hypothetical protein